MSNLFWQFNYCVMNGNVSEMMNDLNLFLVL